MSVVIGFLAGIGLTDLLDRVCPPGVAPCIGAVATFCIVIYLLR